MKCRKSPNKKVSSHIGCSQNHLEMISIFENKMECKIITGIVYNQMQQCIICMTIITVEEIESVCFCGQLTFLINQCGNIGIMCLLHTTRLQILLLFKVTKIFKSRLSGEILLFVIRRFVLLLSLILVTVFCFFKSRKYELYQLVWQPL